jgi:hypothetical protein
MDAWLFMKRIVICISFHPSFLVGIKRELIKIYLPWVLAVHCSALEKGRKKEKDGIL